MHSFYENSLIKSQCNELHHNPSNAQTAVLSLLLLIDLDYQVKEKMGLRIYIRIKCYAVNLIQARVYFFWVGLTENNNCILTKCYGKK